MSTDHQTKYDTESKGPPPGSSPGPPSNTSSLSVGPVSLGFQEKRLLREFSSTISTVLGVNWIAFAYCLGFNDGDVGESHTEPTSKIFRLLSRNAAQYQGNTEEWWERFLQQLTSFGNADLTRKIQSVYNKWKDNQSTSHHDKIYPALHSNISFPSGFDQVSNGSSNHERDNDIVTDRPEISMEINVVAEALDRVSSNSATAEITKWLRDGVPRIIQLERELKSQRELRRIFENETHDLKSKCGEQIRKIADLNLTIKTLESEVAELKNSKHDDQLNEFDFVTRKEARDMKEEEKITAIEKHRAAADDGLTLNAAKEQIVKLEKDTATYKRQIDEIVKVNHSWDEHYRQMKIDLQKQVVDLRKEADDVTAVRNENEQLKAELARVRREVEQSEDDKDTLLIQAKERIDRTEKNLIDKQQEVELVRRKFEKVQAYARSLTNQRKEAEAEIARLNEVLAQKITMPPVKDYRQSCEIQQSAKPSEGAPVDELSTGMASLLANSLEAPPKKRVGSMTETELRDELELLRQQTEVFRSDFNHERQDRQRVMGELDETKKELQRNTRELKKRRPQEPSKHQQLLDDELYAQQLQRQENAAQHRAAPTRRGKTGSQPIAHQPRYQPQAQPQVQPAYRRQAPPPMYYHVDDVNAMQYPQKGLVPHGGGGPGYYYQGNPVDPYGRNYAANDMVIDGTDGGFEDDVEIDGTPPEVAAPPPQNKEDNCPRCKRGFTDDGEYRLHMDRCLVD